MEPCQQEKVIEIVLDHLSRLESKVDKLLEFKWKVTGVAIVVGGLVGMIVRFL